MKFSTAFTSVVLLLPILTAQASVVVPRQGKFGQNRFGGFGGGNKFQGGKGNQGGNNNKGAGAAAAGAGAGAGAAAAGAGAAAANSTAAAASNSTAAAGAAAGAANATAASAGNSNPQDSTTLDPAVIATGFEQNGQATQEAGQVASLTSSNNFINFCATVPNLPITNGKQITTGSCNPAPMGIIPSTQNMPSAKFVSPTNGQNINANTAFTITMAIQGMETGNFVNAQSNYFAAPQQTNAQGQIVGHSHFVVEKLDSLTQTTPTNPNTFAFFKGVNAPAVNGQLSEPVASGLPAGVYRLASINTAANHQPVLVPIAQHGSVDDAVYFTVGGAGSNTFGGAAANATGAAGAAANATGAAGAAGAAASNSTAAAGAAGAAAGAGAAGAAAGKGAAAGAQGAAAGKGAAAGTQGAAAGAAAGKGAAAGATGAGAGAAAGKGAAAGAQGATAAAAGNGAQGGNNQQKGAQGKGRRSRLSREY